MIKLHTPVTDKNIDELRAGDKVFISGTIYTARDQAHIRLLEDKDLKFEINGSIIFYVGPSPARDNVAIGSSGPTSSYRMDKLSTPLMKKGLKVMIGKGDRSEDFRLSMIQNHAVYLITTGGAGALLSSCIINSKIIMYEDLGAEAIRELTVKDFPCFVAYDVYGNNIFKRR